MMSQFSVSIVSSFFCYRSSKLSQLSRHEDPSNHCKVSTLFFSFLSLSVEIVVDILYAILDPRITYGMKSKKNYVLLLKTYLIRKKLIKDLLEKEANESMISTSSKSEVK